MADPTIVLVRGAFADASSWTRLYAELAGDGLTIKAPPNPLRGVTVGGHRQSQWPLNADPGTRNDTCPGQEALARR
jgi:hypothetical protein